MCLFSLLLFFTVVVVIVVSLLVCESNSIQLNSCGLVRHGDDSATIE